MTWKATFKSRYDEFYHLTGDESFAIKDGEIIFSNGSTLRFVDKTGKEDSDSRLIRAETQCLLKAIRKAKRKNLASKSIKWVAGGAFLVLSLFVINGALVTQSAMQAAAPASAGPGASSALSSANAPGNAPTTSTTSMPPHAPQKPAATQGTAASRDDLVAGMQQGVDQGVTVRLGPENADNTLYVFADPLCPHCQKLEPTLQKLASQGTRIEVFPVSVIGGDRSLPLASSALCEATPEEKADVWNAVGSGNPAMDAEACQSGNSAVNLNNKFFQAAGFLGTPTLLNSNGNQPPRSVPRTAEGLHKWLNT